MVTAISIHDHWGSYSSWYILLSSLNWSLQIHSFSVIKKIVTADLVLASKLTYISPKITWLPSGKVVSAHTVAVILLQIIVVVRPGAHFVENHESQFNYNCSGLCVTRQIIWRQTPKLCITVYWNKVYSFYCKAQQRLKAIWLFK